jgi:SagB-type dehydrogenase family enzyme
MAQLSQLLGVLRRHSHAGGYKYNYASAGALYPVRTYLHVRKPESFGVADFAGGAYQYQPASHQLVMISAHVPYDRTLHAPINRPVFEQSAFSIFLIGDLDVIAPVYGDEALRMATLEAGLMTQLLEQAAGGLGLGTCHVGYPADDRYRAYFGLPPSHVLLHMLLIGRALEVAV